MSETASQTQYIRSGSGPTPGSTEVERFELAGPETGVASSTIQIFHVPPGQAWRGGPIHTHRDLDQAFFVLTGTLNLEVDGQAFEVKAGSLGYVPAGVPHRNWNGSTEPITYLEFVPGHLGGAPPQTPAR